MRTAGRNPPGDEQEGSAEGNRRARPEGRALFVRRPARRAARQVARPRRGGRGTRARDQRHQHAPLEGYVPPDGVPGFHSRRRYRHRRDAGRSGSGAARRSVDLPHPAVGARYRLVPLRRPLSGRTTRAVLHPQPPRCGAAEALGFGLRSACRAPAPPGPPPEAPLLTPGSQLLTEHRYDLIAPVVELLRNGLTKLGLPLRSYEIEFGPSQMEITLGAMPGMAAADAMLLFRSAVKQIARRNGYHATFMCRPKLPNVMSSGWHLRQSLIRDGVNAFTPQSKDEALSPAGKSYLAGLLAHARGATALATPTINGYKRYRAYSLAPDRVIWGRDNRGALIRVVGGAGDPATRLENRAGEPAANPYLYFASQIYSGLDGMSRKLSPPPAADAPYEAKAEPLPRTLADALECLGKDDALCQGLGRQFVDYYCTIKEAEIARYNLEVSEWEQREYFDLF